MKSFKFSIVPVFFAGALCLLPISGWSEGRNDINIRANYFFPSGKSFQDIYGRNLAFSAEMNVKVWKSVYLWLIGSYYDQEGSLSSTQERTEMMLVPLGGGVKLKFQAGNISPYVGLGPVVIIYKESNPIGLAKGSGTGFIGQAGLNLKVTARLFFDISVTYSYCRVKPQNIEADIGGIQAGLGIGYLF